MMPTASLCMFDLYTYMMMTFRKFSTSSIRTSSSWPNIDDDKAYQAGVLAFTCGTPCDFAFKEEKGLSIRELARLINGDFDIMVAMVSCHKAFLAAASDDDEHCMSCGVMTDSVQRHDCRCGGKQHLCNECCRMHCACEY